MPTERTAVTFEELMIALKAKDFGEEVVFPAPPSEIRRQLGDDIPTAVSTETGVPGPIEIPLKQKYVTPKTADARTEAARARVR